MSFVKPTLCVASVDSLIGQECLKHCAYQCSDRFASLACLYDRHQPEAFTRFFSDTFLNAPESKLSVASTGCDINEPEHLQGCLTGCDTVLLCPPASLDPAMMSRWCQAMIDACKAAGVRQVVCVSCIGDDCFEVKDPEVWQGADGNAMRRWYEFECAVRNAFPGCVIVRHGFPYQWLRAWQPSMEQRGVFQACWGQDGSGGMNLVDMADVAICLARILCDFGKFSDRVISLSGPSCHDANDLCECWNVKCPGVKYRPCTTSECRALLNKQSSVFPKFMVEQCVAWIRVAAMGGCEWVSSDAAQILGRAPVGLGEWIRGGCK